MSTISGYSLSISDLEKAFQAWTISTSVTYAAFALMIWDMLLTMGDEVAFVWPARFTLIKGLFLFNRYVSPVVLAVNVWTLSGYESHLQLSNTFCRVWLSIAITLQAICLSLVSLIVAMRLRAFYEASRRTLIILLCIWATCFVAAMGLLIVNFLRYLDAVTFIPSLHACGAFITKPWTNWIPPVIDHGIFGLFLLFNTWRTPRSSRTHLLAAMYQQGIIYYGVTFTGLCFGLFIWRFMNVEWFLLPLYTTWILGQMAMSHLLLSVKSSQALQDSVVHQLIGPPQRNSTPLPRRSPTPHAAYGFELNRVIPSDANTYLYPESSTGLAIRLEAMFGPEGQQTDPVKGDELAVPQQPEPSSSISGRLPWWMRSRRPLGDMHVHVDAIEPEDPLEPREEGGLKESRLGRYDHWL